jgi:DNA-binding MarR family transcriptional regulator
MLSYNLTSVNTPNCRRNSPKIARAQAWSLRLFSGSQISEEAFLPLRHPFVSPEGLTITQYSLLANVERAGQLSHAVLAEKVGMERTTLTRNLRPLTRAKWVASATGQDRRQHLLQLTAAGRRKLVRSLPFWEEAQRQFLSQIGTESLQELRALLASTESAVTKAFTADQ